MDELSQDLAELVDVVIRPLVEVEDELDIRSYVNEDDSILVEVRVNPDDAGKVIGRQGRVIKAVRTLVRAAASRQGAMVDVELID